MEKPIYTETYKGLTINIHQDDTCVDSPDQWGDDSLFLVHYHRDFEIRRDKMVTEDEIRAWYQGEKISQEKDYWILPVEAYIHSGVSLALSNEGNFVDRYWDVSHVGAILCSKREWRLKKKAEAAARGLIETWNDYLSGNVWGYVIGGSNDSCWGFYGDYEKNCLQEARSVADTIVERKRKDHQNKIKAQIKHGTPIEKREPFTITQ